MTDLAEMMDRIAVRMRSEFEEARATTDHAASKGSMHETTVRQFLATHVPGSLGVCHGQAMDSTGATSRQLDVMIYDTENAPVLHVREGFRVLPIESVFAAVEVKSYLDGSALNDAIENMLSLKRLQRTAHVPMGVAYHPIVYGTQWDYWPTNYLVLAFDSISLETLAERLRAATIDRDLAVDQRIDMICVLDKGVIMNRHPDGGLDPLPMPGSNLTVIRSDPPERALFTFYLAWTRILPRYEGHPVELKEYASGASMGDFIDLPADQVPRHVASPDATANKE